MNLNKVSTSLCHCFYTEVRDFQAFPTHVSPSPVQLRDLHTMQFFPKMPGTVSSENQPETPVFPIKNQTVLWILQNTFFRLQCAPASMMTTVLKGWSYMAEKATVFLVDTV